MSRADPTRAARWCKTCDAYRQTIQRMLPPTDDKLYAELCLSCDSVCDRSKKPRGWYPSPLAPSRSAP